MRAFDAMMGMKKIDAAAIKAAWVLTRYHAVGAAKKTTALRQSLPEETPIDLPKHVGAAAQRPPSMRMRADAA